MKNTLKHSCFTLLVLGTILLGGCTFSRKPQSQQLLASGWAPSLFTDHQFISTQLHEHPLKLEVVNTASSMSQGLSDRDEIGADGMLFLLGQPGIPTFWMKRMHFDLDMIWLNEGKVVDISRNVLAPPSTTADSQLKIYSPSATADMVLEVRASDAAKWNIAIGDTLRN